MNTMSSGLCLFAPASIFNTLPTYRVRLKCTLRKLYPQLCFWCQLTDTAQLICSHGSAPRYILALRLSLPNLPLLSGDDLCTMACEKLVAACGCRLPSPRSPAL